MSVNVITERLIVATANYGDVVDANGNTIDNNVSFIFMGEGAGGLPGDVFTLNILFIPCVSSGSMPFG